MSRLTESVLHHMLDKHSAECETCASGLQCDAADRIEASFWNEVDRRIDEKKIEGRAR